MSLQFRMGAEVVFRTSASGVIATEGDVFSATQTMLRRMVVEFREYFGLETSDWCYAGDDFYDVHLQYSPTANAGEINRRIQLQIERGVRLRLRGRAEAEIQRELYERQFHWGSGRNRLAEFLGAGDVTLATRSFAPAVDATLIGWEYIPPSGRLLFSRITANPFTWFLANGRLSMTFSDDERARATYSPTLMLLHELNHREGCMVLASDLCSPDGTDHDHDVIERDTVRDVDAVVRDNVGIGQRIDYGSIGPGLRTYVDSDVATVNLAALPRPNSHWVQWPRLRQLQTGR